MEWIIEHPKTTATIAVTISLMVYLYFNPIELSELDFLNNKTPEPQDIDEKIKEMNKIADNGTHYAKTETGGTCSVTQGPHIIDSFAGTTKCVLCGVEW